MFTKLRSNYRLSNVLVRIAFVLCYVLYSWQTSLIVTEMTVSEMTRMGFGYYSEMAVLPMALIVSSMIGVGLMFLMPFLARTFLNVSRFYSVPRSEYGLLSLVFVTMYLLVCGLLRLVNVITPIFLVWGDVLFPFLTSLGCVIWFYVVTSKLYFNDVTKPFYFRNMAIVYFIFAFVFVIGVVL